MKRPATGDMDRISELANDILYRILGFLPMKDAVRTSILSNRWRHLWTYTPNLDFSFDFGSCLKFGETVRPVIDQCLQLHNSETLNRLYLSAVAHEDLFDDYAKWIDFATSKHVNDLILNCMLVRKFYHLPLLSPSLFSCQSLTQLKLAYCVFDPPNDFNGFPNLTVLSLLKVDLDDAIVHTLLANCPLLETLCIRDCDGLVELKVHTPNLRLKNLSVNMSKGLEVLEVDAPHLRYLNYNGALLNFHLQNVRYLIESKLSFSKLHGVEVRGVVRELRALVANISHVKVLTLTHWFIEFILAEHYMNRVRGKVFTNLYELHWWVDLVTGSKLLAVMTLFRDCPSLQKICINIGQQSYPIEQEDRFYRDCSSLQEIPLVFRQPPFLSQGDSLFEALVEDGVYINDGYHRIAEGKALIAHSDYLLHHLKTVELCGFSGSEIEMDLVRILLEKAVVLSLLVVRFCWASNKENPTSKGVLRERISHLPKASPQARIVFYDPS